MGIWDACFQEALQELKEAVMQEPMMRLSDVMRPFELHTEASDFSIGGVLVQEGHPIAYESRNLNETKRRYTVQEKEMTSVILCLRVR